VPKLFFEVADPLNYRNYELKLSEKCAKMKESVFGSDKGRLSFDFCMTSKSQFHSADCHSERDWTGRKYRFSGLRCGATGNRTRSTSLLYSTHFSIIYPGNCGMLLKGLNLLYKTLIFSKILQRRMHFQSEIFVFVL